MGCTINAEIFWNWMLVIATREWKVSGAYGFKS